MKKMFGFMAVFAIFLAIGVSSASAEIVLDEQQVDNHTEWQDGQLDGGGLEYVTDGTYGGDGELVGINDTFTQAKSVHQYDIQNGYLEGVSANMEVYELNENNSITLELMVYLEDGTTDTYTYDVNESQWGADISEISYSENVTQLEVSVIMDRNTASDTSPLADIYHIQYTVDDGTTASSIGFEPKDPIGTKIIEYGEDPAQPLGFEMENQYNHSITANLYLDGAAEGFSVELDAGEYLDHRLSNENNSYEITDINLFTEQSWYFEITNTSTGNVLETTTTSNFLVNELPQTRERTPEDGEVVVGGTDTSQDVTFEYTIDSSSEGAYDLVVNGVVVHNETIPAGENQTFTHTETLDNNAEHDWLIGYKDPEGNIVTTSSTNTFYTQDSQSPELSELTFSGEKGSVSVGMSLMLLGIAVSLVVGLIGFAFKS